MLLARLPMYDLPEMAAANAAFWSAIARQLCDAGIDAVPETLDRTMSNRESWASPRLLFGQSCGYPLMTSFRERLQVVAVPAYRAPGCEGIRHRAWIVVARGEAFCSIEDLRGARFAFNSRDSNTGYNLPRRLFAPLAWNGRFFGAAIDAGSHVASATAVAEGAADAASIDCVSWAHLERHRPALAGRLRILDETPSSPGLPFVTSARTPPQAVAALRQALAEVTARSTPADLRLEGVVHPVDYAEILCYEAEALALSYPALG
jgi:ABC-type phosphate/phosphonate transport system substrate-binding protein